MSYKGQPGNVVVREYGPDGREAARRRLHVADRMRRYRNALRSDPRFTSPYFALNEHALAWRWGT